MSLFVVEVAGHGLLASLRQSSLPLTDLGRRYRTCLPGVVGNTEQAARTTRGRWVEWGSGVSGAAGGCPGAREFAGDDERPVHKIGCVGELLVRGAVVQFEDDLVDLPHLLEKRLVSVGRWRDVVLVGGDGRALSCPGVACPAVAVTEEALSPALGRFRVDGAVRMGWAVRGVPRRSKVAGSGEEPVQGVSDCLVLGGIAVAWKGADAIVCTRKPGAQFPEQERKFRRNAVRGVLRKIHKRQVNAPGGYLASRNRSLSPLSGSQ